MNTNPYAPPHSAVGDVGRDDETLPYSRIAVGVAINAALFGALVLVGAVAGFVRRNPQGSQLVGYVILTLYGVLAVVAAIGLYRQQRWAAIQWVVQSGLFLLIPLFSARFVRSAEFVLVGVLVAQFIVSIVGLGAVVRRRKIRVNV